ncbi:MAG: hypothetical protein HXK70_00230 [Clostridiales bacterium]|nr:hypothetical protein [Clostridiales bacterium]
MTSNINEETLIGLRIDKEIIDESKQNRAENKSILEEYNYYKKKFREYLRFLKNSSIDYNYEEDLEKLYFKLFKSWVKYVGSKKEEYNENIISNIEYISENVELFRNEYMKYYESFRENKNYEDYNYTKIINSIFKNLLEDERLEHYEIIEDMFEKRKISCGVRNIRNSKCYVGEVEDTIYMNLAFDENKYNNMRMFFHELRTLY